MKITRFNSIVVAVAILATSAASLAQTEYQQLREAFNRAMQRESWLAAIDFGKKLHEIDIENGSIAYNIACAQARSGHADEAIRWLHTAARDGYSALALLDRDSDLDSVRDHDEYPSIIARVEENAQQRREQYKAIVAEQQPIVITPRGFTSDGSSPVLIALHGSGGHGRYVARAWRGPAAKLQAAIIAPNAGRRLGAGYQWMYVDESEWHILELRQWAIDELGADPDQIVLVGFSQGANMAIRMALKHPDKFRGAVSMAGRWFDDLWSDQAVAGDREPRIALMVGSRDTAAKSNRVATKFLESKGLGVRYKSFHGLGHVLPMNFQREFERALRFVLEGDGPQRR